MRDRTVDPAALNDLLTERDMTMVKLSKLSKVSYSMIKYVMAGQSQFSDRTAAKIARALGVDVTAFSVPKASRTKDAA